MRPFVTRRISYSRAEFLSDMAVHLLGVLLVTAGVPVLIVLAYLFGNGPGSVFGTMLYGFSFAAMIGCSALYNIFPHPEWEWLFKRLDHSAIYLKIAGTVTGFAMIAGQGWILVTALWAAAAMGVSLKLAAPTRYRWVGLALYLGMGWAAGVLGWGIFAALPAPVVSLIVAGGLTYTIGVAFYLWDGLPYHFTIWHIFVLIASLLLYSAVVIAVLQS